MEKENRKIKIIFLICALFIFSVGVISSYVFLYFDELHSSFIIAHSLEASEWSQKKEELSRLDEEIQYFSHLDEEIDKVRKEFFDSAKKLEDSIRDGSSSKKIAYLTFDDGPYYNTYRVLDILDQYNVGATFFTTNANGNDCYDNKGYDCTKLYMEYVRHGHTIANHTYTHAIFKGLYTSVDTFIDAINRQHDLVKEHANGYVMNILRFPGGSDTANHFKVRDAVIERLKQLNYGWVDWSSLDGDGGYLPNQEVAWKNLNASINEDIEVILFHDYSPITTAILPDVIERLESQGYVLLPLFYESSVVNK